MRCAGLSESEINALTRWRYRLVHQLPRLRGKDLQCWCPLSSEWCHADTLLWATNTPGVWIAP